MQSRTTRARPIGALDVASSALYRLAPSGLGPHIEQARHDVRALVDGLTGVREPTFIDPATPRTVPVPLASIDPIEHVLPGRALRQRWVTLRTDVTWVLRDLRGERRPAVVARKPSRYASAPEPRPVTRPLAQAARTVRVESVVRETEHAVSIVLRELDGSPLAFEAGQFLTLQLTIEGAPLRRAYSLSTSPLDGPSAAITVKRIEGGRGSSWIHEHVREGDTLSVLGPSGTFVAPAERTPARLVMIAGGSGITPVISIAETVLRSRPELDVVLVYGNRSERDVIFADRIERLRAEHGSRFVVDHVLSDPSEAWTGPRGLLDRATIDARLDAIGASDDRPSLYYVCGPTPMMDAAREALAARGVAVDAIREERFHSPADASVARESLPDRPVSVRMKVRGRDHLVRVDPGQTLLEAGLAAGAALPFSCTMGGCGACKVKLVSGAVQAEEPNCLTPRERSEGWVLSCCSRPTGPVALEVVE